MNRDNYTPRFSFEITPEQQLRASQLFATHGQRRAVMSIVLDDVLDLLEKHGQVISGLIMSKTAKPKEIIPSLAQAEMLAGKLST